jgi:methylthioribulose-1-phosphate dehydratase
MDMKQSLIRKPIALKPSACTPLFFNAYKMRDAGACIHTHSQNAVMVTLLFGDEFKISHQEMIKGIRIGTTRSNYRYFDTLTVPIIDNTPEEEELTVPMESVSGLFFRERETRNKCNLHGCCFRL